MININSLNRILLFSIFNVSVMFIFLQKKYKNTMNLSEMSCVDKELFSRERSLCENTQKYFFSLVKNIKTQTYSIVDDKSVQTDSITEDKSVQTDPIIENKEIQTNFIIMNNSVYNDYYDIIDEEGNLFVIL